METSEIKQARYSEEQAKKLYDMKLHEEIQDGGFYISRVPGGWIYGRPVGQVFVPYDNSFEGDASTRKDEAQQESRHRYADTKSLSYLDEALNSGDGSYKP